MKKTLLLCFAFFSLSVIAQTASDPLKGFSTKNGFNAIEFLYHVINADDFTQAKQYILNSTEFAFKKDYENAGFLSADRTEGNKERFWMGKEDQNEPGVKNAEISITRWAESSIESTLKDLGFTETSKRETKLGVAQVVIRKYQNSAGTIEAAYEYTQNHKIKKTLKFTKISGEQSAPNRDTGQSNENGRTNLSTTGQTIVNRPAAQLTNQALPKVNERKIKVKGVEFSMRFVPHGTFIMGKGNNTVKVELSNDFWVSETEVTTALWDVVMERKTGGTGRRPVTCTWLSAMEFVRRLNTLTGYNFRMITEAEWEYAARYGNGNKQYSGGNTPKEVLNSGEVKDSAPEALNKPNALGIYGMSNKTSEWCYDIYQEKYPSQPQRNYQGPMGENMGGMEKYHVVRSGGAMYYRQNSQTDLFDRSSEHEGLVALGIRLAIYDNDVKNQVKQVVVEKRKVNLPAVMPNRWRGSQYKEYFGTSLYLFIKNERHTLIENPKLEGKVGYGYLNISTSNDKGLYVIEKIVVTGKNAFTLTLVPAEGGQRRTASFTYNFKSKTWIILKTKSTAIAALNNATFNIDPD